MPKQATSFSVAQVLQELEKLGDEKVKETKKRFAIHAENSHGIFMKDLKLLAKRIGKNSTLALQLFESGVYEARLLCRMLFKEKDITEAQMEAWVKTFENWEICDTYCMGFLGKSPFAEKKIPEWIARDEEYQKRAGFVLMVTRSYTDRQAKDDVFEAFFPLLITHANDERTYVMKAINWALRQIGKRNDNLRQKALEVAQQILSLNSKPARWIARDAIRELSNPKVAMRNYPRSSS